MIVLCTHHKGGVGKTELAIHAAGIFRLDFQRTLLIDCDSQASAWKFYFGESPTQENEPRAVDELLSVVYNPKRLRLGRLAEEGDFDHYVLDIDTPLEHTVQAILQQNPDLILVPVNLQAEAILNLPDPLEVIGRLETTISNPGKVRIVPLGAKLAAIKAKVQEIQPRIQDLTVAPRVRDLHRETNVARRERYYIWDHPGCARLQDYFRKLLRN